MKFCTVMILLTSLILQGCIGTVAVGAAALAAKISVDPRTVGTQVDDIVLTKRVSFALDKDQQLRKESRIVNATYQGKVLLIGQAPTLSLKERAKKIAMNVDGVVKVYNEIRINDPIFLKRKLIDTWITTAIYVQLLINEKVKMSDLQVYTENGEVFLIGLVTKKEGEEAAAIASKIHLVKRVIIAFSYIL